MDEQGWQNQETAQASSGAPEEARARPILQARERSHRRWNQQVGVICSALLLIVTIGVYAFKFVQLDGWQYYTFRGTINLEDRCTIAVSAFDTPTINTNKVTNNPTFYPIKIPHKRDALQMFFPADAQRLALHYRCLIPTKLIPQSEGVSYLHTGWIFGETNQININGAKRAEFAGNDKPSIALLQSDLGGENLLIEILVTAPAKNRIGLTGGQKMVIGVGSVVNVRIFGLETALGGIKPLYNLLPVLFLGLVCILGWVQGFRFRLIVAAMFFCILSATKNLVLMIADLFPWEYYLSLALGELLVTGPGLAFLIFGMELLGVGGRFINPAMGALIGLLGLEVGAFLITKDRSLVYDQLMPAYAVVLALGTLCIVVASIRKLRRGEVPEERRVINKVFVIFLAITGLLPSAELLLNTMQIWISLSSYADVFMPLFLGAVLFRTLVLIERTLRIERESRTRMEGELAIAAELQTILVPSALTGSVHGWKYGIESKAHGILGGDWAKVHRGPNRSLLAIGDVVGKGPSAALTHSGIAACWDIQIKGWDKGQITMESLLDAMNETMFSLFHGSMNSTFAVIEVADAGKVRVASSGSYWLHLSTSRSTAIPPGVSSLLGISSNIRIVTKEFQCQDGDWLLCFTDGVLEGNRAIKRFMRAAEESISSLTEDSLRDLLREAGKDTVHPDDASSLILHFKTAA